MMSRGHIMNMVGLGVSLGRPGRLGEPMRIVYLVRLGSRVRPVQTGRREIMVRTIVQPRHIDGPSTQERHQGHESRHPAMAEPEEPQGARSGGWRRHEVWSLDGYNSVRWIWMPRRARPSR